MIVLETAAVTACFYNVLLLFTAAVTDRLWQRFSSGALRPVQPLPPPDPVPTMGDARHSTAARAAFRKDFSAALAAISKLDKARPGWAETAARKSAVAAPPPAAQPAAVSFQGKETTNQLAYKAYNLADSPAAFQVSRQHRKMRDDYTDFVEALFMERNLFGKPKSGH